jgi:hypothetical protein
MVYHIDYNTLQHLLTISTKLGQSHLRTWTSQQKVVLNMQHGELHNKAYELFMADRHEFQDHIQSVNEILQNIGIKVEVQLDTIKFAEITPTPEEGNSAVQLGSAQDGNLDMINLSNLVLHAYRYGKAVVTRDMAKMFQTTMLCHVQVDDGHSAHNQSLQMMGSSVLSLNEILLPLQYWIQEHQDCLTISSFITQA